MIFTWCYILYYIYICIVSYIYVILIVLRPPCKQQTINFESWNLNSARPKNSDWSWFGEKLARSNFPRYSPVNYVLLQNKKTASTPIADLRKSRRRRVWCARRPWDPISICIGPRPRSNTISNTELLQTVTKYALGQNHWTGLQVSTA